MQCRSLSVAVHYHYHKQERRNASGSYVGAEDCETAVGWICSVTVHRGFCLYVGQFRSFTRDNLGTISGRVSGACARNRDAVVLWRKTPLAHFTRRARRVDYAVLDARGTPFIHWRLGLACWIPNCSSIGASFAVDGNTIPLYAHQPLVLREHYRAHGPAYHLYHKPCWVTVSEHNQKCMANIV